MRKRIRSIEPIGVWLFHRRSALGLLLVPVAVLGLRRGPAPYADAAMDGLTACAVVAIALGLASRVLVAGHSRARASMRGVERFQADTLSTTGPYSLLRHPLYAANMLIGAALVGLLREISAFALGVALLVLVYAAIASAEDVFLARRFGALHAQWRRETPAFIPTPSRFRRAAVPFSTRTALRREHPSWLAVSALALGIDTLVRWRLEWNPPLSPGWIAMALCAAILFGVARVLKTRTRALHVPGR